MLHEEKKSDESICIDELGSLSSLRFVHERQLFIGVESRFCRINQCACFLRTNIRSCSLKPGLNLTLAAISLVLGEIGSLSECDLKGHT
jgi:hypothetical protein